MADANRGRKASEASRKKMSEGVKKAIAEGRGPAPKPSKETRKKLSEAALRQHAKRKSNT